MLGVPELLVGCVSNKPSCVEAVGGLGTFWCPVDVGVECSILFDRGAIVGR